MQRVARRHSFNRETVVCWNQRTRRRCGEARTPRNVAEHAVATNECGFGETATKRMRGVGALHFAHKTSSFSFSSSHLIQVLLDVSRSCRRAASFFNSTAHVVEAWQHHTLPFPTTTTPTSAFPTSLSAKTNPTRCSCACLSVCGTTPPSLAASQPTSTLFRQILSGKKSSRNFVPETSLLSSKTSLLSSALVFVEMLGCRC